MQSCLPSFALYFKRNHIGGLIVNNKLLEEGGGQSIEIEIGRGGGSN